MNTDNQQPAPEPQPQPAAEARSAEVTKDVVRGMLCQVYDPELHMSVVDLGLIYGLEVQDGTVDLRMTLTTPGCPYGPQLMYEVDQSVRSIPGVKTVNLDLVWDPPWSPDKMSEEARLELGFDV